MDVSMSKAACPFCGQPAVFLFEAMDENRHITEDHFRYFKCDSCGLVFLLNPPIDLGRYYQAEYYEIPNLDRLRKIARKDTERIDTVRKFTGRGRLLEIGPAFGVFAWQAKNAGFEVDVIEMDSRCCEHLRNVVGVNVTQSDRPEASLRGLRSHDVIALWHVI